jgi:hypothetical protein
MIKYLKQYKTWYSKKTEELTNKDDFILNTLKMLLLMPIASLFFLGLFAIHYILLIINPIVALILWLFIFKKEKDINKRIVNIVENSINKDVLKQGLLHFNRTEKDIDINNFFYINTIKPTLDYKGKVQCDNNKRRSLGDIYRILKYYNKDITIKDVILQLDASKSSTGYYNNLSISYCNTIEKCVFTTDSTYYNHNCKTEFMLDGEHLTWSKIVEAYKSK